MTIVVPVLITSCQMSEYWKTGPVTAQIRMATQARSKVSGRRHCRDVQYAALLKQALSESGRFYRKHPLILSTNFLSPLHIRSADGTITGRGSFDIYRHQIEITSRARRARPAC